MAIGVTSYGEGRRRRRPPPVTDAPRPPLPPWLARAEQVVRAAWPLLRVPLTLVALAHLLALALFPAGRNELFGVGEQALPGYLTWFRVPDTLGFYTTDGTDGFLVYKIYTQEGATLQGSFPDVGVAPKLRYDRWATAGDAAAGPHPSLHAFVLDYILNRLPSPPLRLDLFAARWQWDRNSLRYPWPGPGPETSLELRRLGSYNGFTRTWEPVKREAK